MTSAALSDLYAVRPAFCCQIWAGRPRRLRLWSIPFRKNYPDHGGDEHVSRGSAPDLWANLGLQQPLESGQLLHHCSQRSTPPSLADLACLHLEAVDM